MRIELGRADRSQRIGIDVLARLQDGIIGAPAADVPSTGSRSGSDGRADCCRITEEDLCQVWLPY